ncbi:unnamed protein product [Agarophyton chilense]
MSKNDAESSPTKSVAAFFRTTFVPVALMLISPPAVQLVWVICYHYDGNALLALLFSPIDQILSNFPHVTAQTGAIVLAFLFMQALLLRLVPATTFVAIPTPMGNRPTYRLNGVRCFIITHALILTAYAFGLFSFVHFYHVFGEILAFLNAFALAATVFLYVRGLYFPTNSDSGKSGHGFVWDMWQGTELHPEMFEMSLKQLINCRFAMMGWSVAVVAFAMSQYETIGYVSNSMFVSAFLQTVYIFKFFVWEAGYFNSVDIIHDRFGFYIFWGCSAFLPSIYTLTSYFLTTHAVQWPVWGAVATGVSGLAALGCNYWTDYQRQMFRAANGECKVWGRAPRIIEATYTTGDGKRRRSVLLASGWWGVARHINYVFEITLALCWSLPAARSGVMPYVYVSFLTILLTDRAYRDELRCAAKYGSFYDEYCRLVPWRMIPGVY